MATFASAKSVVAYDKDASQPMGALCTGMGYDPATATTTTKPTQYIGGAVETIGYGKGVADVPPVKASPAKAEK